MRKRNIIHVTVRLLSLVLTVTLLLALAGCRPPWTEWDEYADLPPFEQSRSFSYSADFSAIEDKMTLVRGMIAAGEDYDGFCTLYEELNSTDSDHILDQLVKYELLRDMDRSNAAYSDGYEKCRAFKRSFLLWIIETEELIAASAFRALYYEGMSDDEILDYLQEIKGVYNEEERALQEQIDALEDAFYNGTAEDLYTLYAELLSARNALAALNSYENYSAYAYAELYERSYTVAEARRICDYVAQYLVPTANAVNDRYSALRAEASYWSQDEIDAYNSFWYRGFQRYGAKAYLDAYADAVGGELQAVYANLWENGYYFYGNDPEYSYQGAYQGYLEAEQAPFLYFGPYYQSVMTVAHEFGHYYHATKGDNADYDLLELHSQGNEMLFISYFKQQYESFSISDRCAELIVLHQYADALDGIVSAAAVQLFEELSYAAQEPSRSDLVDIMRNVLEKYGFSEEQERYILSAAIESPCYYVSYAVSGVSALLLGALAEEDLAVASEKYGQLCGVSDDVKLTEALLAVEMTSFFEESAYIAISDRYGATTQKNR